MRLQLKIFLISVLLLTVAIEGSSQSQGGKRLSISVTNMSVRGFLDELHRKTQAHFIYDEESVDPKVTVTITAKNSTLDDILKECCSQTALRYEYKNNLILILPAEGENGETPQETIVIKGCVTDDKGAPMPGVSIYTADGKDVTTSDASGNYSLKVSTGRLLNFTFFGMTDRSVKIVPGMKTLNVRLEPSAYEMDEVVVTGYQTLSKERATGSFSVVSQGDFQEKLQSNIMSRLEGRVAGMVSRQGSGVTIRGISTINGNSNPLYIVDNMPYEGKIELINPANVVNITILKDAGAASIYGARAANGVIVITTRKGTKDSRTNIRYDGSLEITPIPNINSLNLMSTKELIELQMYGFKDYHSPYEELNKRRYMDPITSLLYDHEQKKISTADLDKQLAYYGSIDNREQIRKELQRVGTMHQHNVSISGGNEKNSYIASLNYMENKGTERFSSGQQLGFSLRDEIKFFDWLTGDMGVSGAFIKSMGNSGAGSSSSLYQSYPSYYMLRDKDNNPLEWKRYKSEYELKRLTSLGLLDERFFPLINLDKERYNSKESSYRIFAGLDFKINDHLNFNIKYQTEVGNHFFTKHSTKDSYAVTSMINNAAQVDKNGVITYNIPTGEQLSQVRGDSFSYTIRGQMNYNRTFADKHALVALAGAERRLVKSSSTANKYMGYDDNSLAYKPLNARTISSLRGTQALSGSFVYDFAEDNYVAFNDERFVSLFGNMSYTYDDRYALTGSIRIDQANLFGTDPKYQYRPLWSLGGSWYMKNEKFMQDVSWISNLNLRFTYGIGGNVPRGAGPYMTFGDDGYNDSVNDFSNFIVSPPNPTLRWEKTATTNIGLDFAFVNHRIFGSIDLYNKYTSDLLDTRSCDPTLGWGNFYSNYGTMYNRGFELSLNSLNIENKNFSWESGLTFSYNKSKLLTLDGTRQTVFSYTAGSVRAIDYPLGAIFSYRYAGLNPQDGSPLVYEGYGDEQKTVLNVGSISDLVYSGTRTPKYAASLSNRLSYKGISLSFMFVYYGGHVMRNAVGDYLTGAPNVNTDRATLNFWKKPGDEKIENIAPAMNRDVYYTEMQTWYAADKHVLNADFIKLRELIISYGLPSSMLQKLNIQGATISCQVNNLFNINFNKFGLDSEAMSTTGYGRGARGYSIPTTWTFGLSLNF